MGAGGEHCALAAYLQERPSTHCIAGWLGPRAGLDRCRKSCLHWNSIPGLSSL